MTREEKVRTLAERLHGWKTVTAYGEGSAEAMMWDDAKRKREIRIAANKEEEIHKR